MNRSSILLGLSIAATVCFSLGLTADPAFAAPGGQIASAVFRSTPGKILLGLLVIILLPMLLYVQITESLAVRRTLRDLRQLAAQHDAFDWFQVKDRVTDAFHRVHAAWRREDMHEAAQWMTGWYWQNQQLAYLDQWERDGLVNHCRVKSIGSIRPLFVRYRNNQGVLDGSRLVVSITANMEDYLAERQSGRVVQGKPGYTEVESIWTFVFENGRWLVASIEEGAVSLQYAKLVNELSPGAAPGAYEAA